MLDKNLRQNAGEPQRPDSASRRKNLANFFKIGPEFLPAFRANLQWTIREMPQRGRTVGDQYVRAFLNKQ
jgi:hypothetical protein